MRSCGPAPADRKSSPGPPNMTTRPTSVLTKSAAASPPRSMLAPEIVVGDVAVAPGRADHLHRVAAGSREREDLRAVPGAAVGQPSVALVDDDDVRGGRERAGDDDLVGRGHRRDDRAVAG